MSYGHAGRLCARVSWTDEGSVSKPPHEEAPRSHQESAHRCRSVALVIAVAAVAVLDILYAVGDLGWSDPGLAKPITGYSTRLSRRIHACPVRRPTQAERHQKSNLDEGTGAKPIQWARLPS